MKKVFAARLDAGNRRMTLSQDLINSILTCIHKNLGDPSLSSTALADKFQISAFGCWSDVLRLRGDCSHEQSPAGALADKLYRAGDLRKLRLHISSFFL